MASPRIGVMSEARRAQAGKGWSRIDVVDWFERGCSSTGQSNGFLNRRLAVQVRPLPPEIPVAVEQCPRIGFTG